LDAIDACRKDVAKRKQDSYVSPHQKNQMTKLKDSGMSGQMLLDKVCSQKDDLVKLFEQIFGKQRLKEMPVSRGTKRSSPRPQTMAESERQDRIMSDPIEALIKKTHEYQS
jgi:hypothetical protein